MHASKNSDEAIAEAIKKELYNQRYWKLLLHYSHNKSEIDDPDFFLSPKGASNPKAELVTTIEKLYFEKTLDDNSTACKYPARTQWLKEKLHLSNLPHVECRRYKKILNKVDPRSATIVFPAAHINSPASMFGHTFIRINSSYNSRLLAYAVNYAADADPTKENGVVFALKGLFGGYAGKYSLLPYYDKLKEYRDTENRDIWEYDLNLTAQETRRMFDHIWEIQSTKASYRFLTDNCSYEMLWLIEVARPSVHLREHFTYQVIPLETIHALKKESLLQQSHYRPSKRSVVEAYKKVLSFEAIRLAKELAKGERPPKTLLQTPWSLDTKRYTLEAAIELTQYYYQSNDLSKERYLDIFHSLTSTRAKLGKTKKVSPLTPPDPLTGHQALRLTLGVRSTNGKSGMEIGFRPAYHNLDDPAYGFLRGTKIEFFDIESYIQSNRLYLDKATILAIESIPQFDNFFHNFSWRMHLGWDRNFYDTKSRFDFSVGAGASVGNRYGYIYTFLDPHLHVTSSAQAALSASVGCVLDGWSEWMQLHAEYTLKRYERQRKQNILTLSQTFRIKQNFAWNVKYEYHDRFSADAKRSHENLYSFLLYYYF